MVLVDEVVRCESRERVRGLGLVDEAAERITFFSTEGFDLRHNLERLQMLLEEYTPDLLVLDAYRSLWGGEENASEEVAPVLDALRTHDTAVLLLHHTTKDGRSYRGSSAIGASAELMFVLGREDGDPDPARRSIRCRKSRPAPEPPAYWLRFSTELTSIQIEEADAPLHLAGDTTRPVRDRLCGQVIELFRSGPMRSRSDVARALERDPKDRTVGRVLKELVAAGQLQLQPDRTYILVEGGISGTA